MRQLFTLLCCLAGFTSFSQTINMAYSEPFDEPDALDAKVVQCPNGNTFLFSFTKKDGIDVTVYDKSHKQIASRKLEGGSGSWNPSDMAGSMFSGVSRGSKMCAIYPMNNQVVLFLEQVSDRAPSLYRIALNSADGKLIREEKIAEMPAYASGSGYAMAFGNVRPKGFFVERDPANGAYAVLAFDGFAEETEKRIELIHFSADHQEIARSYYESPQHRYKYINYLGMVVNGTKEVHLATYCFNGAGGGGSKIFLSDLKNSALAHHPLEFTANLKDTKGALIYNRVTKHLELFTLSEVSTKTTGRGLTYLVKQMFITIDPETHAVLSNKMVGSQLASKYRKSKYDKSATRYTGIPMNMVVNADGTTTIVSEDQVPRLKKQKDLGGIILNSIIAKRNIFITDVTPNISYNDLMDIGITDYDEQSNEQYGYVVRKSKRNKAIIPPLTHTDRNNNRVIFNQPRGFNTDANTGFYSFDYISTPAGRFAIFNDHPKNFKQDAEKKPKRLQGVSAANTVCYRLKDGEMSKFYFFGQPDDSFDNRLALITSGDYSEATGDYAVMMIERNGRKKQARIAWAHLN